MGVIPWLLPSIQARKHAIVMHFVVTYLSILYRLYSTDYMHYCNPQATVRNKDNQSYLVVFDGSVLLSKIVR